MLNPRSLSLWHDTLPSDDLARLRSPLVADTECDVVIVGGGFTGLWTAYYLHLRDPSLRVVVVEAEFAGFGASGRNGGWASGLLPMSLEQVAAESSRSQALALQQAANDSVDEIGRVSSAEKIDAQFVKGGYLRAATSLLQRTRLLEQLGHARSWGQSADDLMWLDRSQARERINADGVFAALYSPHCAAIHPARLARGLAEVVERQGTVVYEQSPALAIRPGRVSTARGDVRARVVVRALEGYTRTLPSHRRTLLPIYSLMIATEPLPNSIWHELGWQAREVLNDDRKLLFYAQRTADGRIAFGGRGAPYHLGSRINASFEHPRRVHDALRQTLVSLFPALADCAITHRWGGVLGIPRDWFASVNFDPLTGMASAGGYSGDGVTLTNLAGRTLADLITDSSSELVRLPWVGHRSRPFEPEPFRYLGINASLRLAAAIDTTEQRTGRPARITTNLMQRLTGQ